MENLYQIPQEIKWFISKAIKDGKITRPEGAILARLYFYEDINIAIRQNRATRHRLFLIKLFGKCKKCGTTRNLTQDHIIPKREDGVNALRNKQLLCFKCN